MQVAPSEKSQWGGAGVRGCVPCKVELRLFLYSQSLCQDYKGRCSGRSGGVPPPLYSLFFPFLVLKEDRLTSFPKKLRFQGVKKRLLSLENAKQQNLLNRLTGESTVASGKVCALK